MPISPSLNLQVQHSASAVKGGRGVQETEIYPMYKERFPIQLLNFIRFSRIQDIGELAKVQFDNDVMISPQNEYEVLQLVMADLRERLQGYRENQVRFRTTPPSLLTCLLRCNA